MPLSLAPVNRLPKEVRDALYLRLIPCEVFSRFSIDPNTLRTPDGFKAVKGQFPPDENSASIEVVLEEGGDPVFYCQISLDPFFRSLNLDYVVMNDPRSPRFNVDRDEEGRETLCGILRRNIPEEIRAMRAGLAPGMVRKGLGFMGSFMRNLEAFTLFLGLSTVTLEALFYHTARLFEAHGFAYFRGMRLMAMIEEEFRPGGRLHRALDGSTPFRSPGMERTVRGRSWAIHDGILEDALGLPWEPPKMYKALPSAANPGTLKA